MKLPFSLLGKKEKPEYFLALVLRNEQVNAVIFESLSGKIRVLGKHKEYFTNSIEEASVKEMLETFDKAISAVESSLPQSIETIKTIFGIKESWTENNKIKKDYLLKLKKICDELGLTPIGFIIIFEAIAHLLQKEEGAPVTIILAEIGEKIISVALVRGGKIIEIRSSQILETPTVTVDTILKHFTSVEVLPARIVIFDADEDKSQEFINHRWSKTLPFLHLPQVSTLPLEFDARAVLFGAATQMGFELLEETPSKEIEKIDTSKKGTIKEGKDEFEGMNGKIKQVGKENSMEYFGFIENQDIAKQPQSEKLEEVSQVPDEILEEQISEIPKEVTFAGEKTRQLPTVALAVFSAAKKFMPKLLTIIKRVPVKKLFSGFPVILTGRMTILIPAIAVIILLVLSYIFIPHATVAIGIDPKIIKENQDVVFSASLKSDPTNNIVFAEFVSVSLEGTISTSATGKKEVGTKAKGTVTIFNNSSKTETLSSNTTLSTGNGLKFTLDKNVSVSSASGDIFTGTTPGKGTVPVTASEIGNEYNLPSNTKLSVGGSSTIAAKNDDAFSGGTKKEITVVSKDDITKLTEELPKSLEQKAKEDLSKKITDDKVLLPNFISKAVSGKNFSKDAGDEASQVSLKAAVEYEGISYAKKDLISFADTLIKNKTPADLIIDPENLKVEVKDIKQKENKDVSANLDIGASLKPNIDEKKLKKDLAGKSFKNAEDLVMKISQVSDVQISLNIPFLPKRLPFLSGSIKIKTIIND